MTFCLGIKVRDGLVGIADTRITMGSETITAHKVSVFRQDGQTLFLMTSGLRSVRDKALTYFEEKLAIQKQPFDRLYKAVNALAACVRQVEAEDKAALQSAGLYIDLHCLVGGQLANDGEHKLYLMYPQGNWVEVGAGTPYQIVGIGSYGKPILDRTLRFEDSLQFALKMGCLAFDSTRISASDVDFPVDVVLYRAHTFQVVQHTYAKEDLLPMCTLWQDTLRRAAVELPSTWVEGALAQLPPPVRPAPGSAK
ncbi:MAG TPA: peptidase [bacterium]|nr:peptidase [bacterium]